MTIGRFNAARAAHKLHARGLLARRDVNAVSVGLRSVGGADTDEPCVTAWVDRKLPAGALPAARLLPTKLPIAAGETLLDVRQSTRLVAPAGAAPSVIVGDGSTVAATRERLRPIQGGVSGASFRFPIGTLTCVVADAIDPGQQFLLSCNHVLADVNAGSVGDPVLQPAFSDGGNTGDTVAWLARWMPLSFTLGRVNYVDAAVALVPDGACLPDVVEAGRVAGVRSAASLEPGEAVRKVGRTSGMTNETVLGTDADVWVTYWTASGLMQALFTQQILTTACAAYGDSGSPLLDADNRIVGMLFSGTAQTTAFNRFDAIETMLGVRFVATT